MNQLVLRSRDMIPRGVKNSVFNNRYPRIPVENAKTVTMAFCVTSSRSNKRGCVRTEQCCVLAAAQPRLIEVYPQKRRPHRDRPSTPN